MPQTTGLALIARAKAASDMRDNFVTPTQWYYWLNQERYALDLFLARSGWTQSIYTAMLDQTLGSASTNLYPLSDSVNPNPTFAIMALVGIWEKDSSGRTRLLKQSDFISMMHQSPGTTLSQGHARYYTLSPVGDNLSASFYPALSTSDTYIFSYIPHPVALVVGDGLGVNYPMGWEERIVLGMARRALIKEESSTTAIDREIETWDQRIEELCWNRSLATNPQIRNTDRETYGWGNDIMYPAADSWYWI